MWLRNGSLTVILGVLLLASAAPAQPQAESPTGHSDVLAPPERFPERLREGHLSTIPRFSLVVGPGETLEIETANPSSGSDPVLHLFDADTREQIAVDDDGAGGPNARLTHAGAGGRLIVVLRSKQQNKSGSVDLVKNGEVWHSDVDFGGWHLAFSELDKGEVLQTVHLPAGSVGLHHLYLLDEQGMGVAHSARGGGVAGAVAMSIPTDPGRRVVVVGTASPDGVGRARIVLNDAGLANHDQDGDGLGAELEADLGTCDKLSGSATGMDGESFDCSVAADARDTDGDGLRDDWETLGLARSYKPSANTTVHENLMLPAWGATPRHKDLFVEVDFMERMPEEPTQRLQPSRARQFARYYRDELDDPTPLIDAFRAAVLRNPDRKRGIRVHLDTGVAPQSPGDAEIYGDWGGFTSVPSVTDDNGNHRGADYKTAWKDHMSPARRGVFRYVLAYASGGGQTAINSYSAAGPMTDAWVLAHEFGHAMGLGHSGPAGATGVVDPNCKPNYESMLNYAFQNSPVGFSDGLPQAPLNNAALREWKVVNPSQVEYLNVLEGLFEYWVDRAKGHVDWNRDGEFAPIGTTVRAYANFRPGAGCEFTRYNQAMIPGAASIQSPAMARLGDRLYVFYSVLGLLFYTHSTDAGHCPVPDLTPCATWADTEPLLMDAGGGVDVVRMGSGSSAKLLVVTIDGAGKLWQRRLSLGAGGVEEWENATLIPGTSLATGEPSFSDLGHCKIFLSYRGEDGVVRFNRLSCSDNFENWQGEQRALDEIGSEIAIADFTSPGIGRAFLSEPGLASLYGAFANLDGKLRLYRYDETYGHWASTDLLEGDPRPIEGRPSLAWTSEHTAPDFPGRLYLLFIDRDDTRPFREKQRTVRMLISYARVQESAAGQLERKLKVGLYAPFDNVWNYAFGVDTFFEAGVDSNLRAVQSVAINKPEVWAKLQFRPKADGINDFTMVNFNDWETMRVTLCRNLVNPGELVAEPEVECPAS